MSRARLGLASALLAASAQAVAAPAFDPRSTAAAPCGVGVPEPGHEMPELLAERNGATLTVRQDGGRLCYVAGDIADAPVIRTRQGADLVLTLRNEIVDPAAIEAVMTPGTLKTANVAVPEAAGYYRVMPGMHHAATGATNLHVHGFAVPPVAPQDDVMTVCTDPAVGPATCGRRQFTYRYRIPAGMPEGLYWYHPHVHGEVQAQMLMGLTGAIVVEGPEHDARRAAGVVERVLVVRQTQDQDAGKTPAASMTAAPAGPSSPAHGRAVADTVDTAHELLCASNAGIDQISLNGTPVPVGDAPDAALARLEIAAGTRQFWQLLNAATDAFLSLSLVDEQGRALPLQVAARDGSPLSDDAGRRLLPAPTAEAQAVPPGGRIEFWVAAPPPGTKAWLVTHAIDTGCAGDRLPERRLARVVAGDPAGTTTAAIPAPSPAAAPGVFSGVLSHKVDRRRVIAMAEYPRPGTADQTDFYIFERKPGAVLRTYMMGDGPAIVAKAGSTEEWVIENWTNELHTFHIHQLHFRVLEVDGRPSAAPELLDVVEVPYATATGFHSKKGPVRPGRVRLRMSFPAELAGDIPFHCHLVDHEDNGMMAVLRVVGPGLRSRPMGVRLPADTRPARPQR